MKQTYRLEITYLDRKCCNTKTFVEFHNNSYAANTRLDYYNSIYLIKEAKISLVYDRGNPETFKIRKGSYIYEQ